LKHKRVVAIHEKWVAVDTETIDHEDVPHLVTDIKWLVDHVSVLENAVRKERMMRMELINANGRSTTT
jgi:hypothetical protein